MSDFAFLDRPLPTRSRKQHMEDIRRDAFKKRLLLIADNSEEATDHCRDMIRAGSDVTEELNELETTARGLLLLALLLKREAKGVV